MKAVMFVPAPDGAGVEVREVDMPRAEPGEVLVRVKAAGLNRAELAIRRGLRSGAAQPSGIEFAGEVAALGAGATRFHIGDRVMGHWRAGQAEFVAADEDLLVPVPPRLSWVEAAAWLNVFVTAHDAIVTNAQLKPGESIMVTAASSNVGIAALQIARLLGANPVIGSSRSPAKLEKLVSYGLQVGVEAGARGAAIILEATGRKGVDVMIDNVGGVALKQNLECMGVSGRMVSVGRLAGDVGELNLDLLALNRIKLIGVTFRTRTKRERIECVKRCANDLWGPLQEGRLSPVVHRSFPMHDIKAAHDCMEKDEHIGKLVIEIS